MTVPTIGLYAPQLSLTAVLNTQRTGTSAIPADLPATGIGRPNHPNDGPDLRHLMLRKSQPQTGLLITQEPELVRFTFWGNQPPAQVAN